MKIDAFTLLAQRGRYAHLAVEVDLSMPLNTHVKLDEEVIHVMYKGLPQLCFQCGRVGHEVDACPLPGRTAVEVHHTGEDRSRLVSDDATPLGATTNIPPAQDFMETDKTHAELLVFTSGGLGQSLPVGAFSNTKAPTTPRTGSPAVGPWPKSIKGPRGQNTKQSQPHRGQPSPSFVSSVDKTQSRQIQPTKQANIISIEITSHSEMICDSQVLETQEQEVEGRSQNMEGVKDQAGPNFTKELLIPHQKEPPDINISIALPKSLGPKEHLEQ
ncbi:hypothetical protein K2173_010585 [Erythroxylum novogranatense]|uniref:CCHC-type domain-containing protein n=1 Tax=Erythroxylum novogranatense TaxID=1862640 RepID=A0AAV8TE14_9ROSI|nr:hypothetical protein K2173_010585 [Erythroxylum novogranatense]